MHNVMSFVGWQMAPMAIGRIAMRYRQVECAPPGVLKVEVDKNYGSGRWLRLMVEVWLNPSIPSA